MYLLFESSNVLNKPMSHLFTFRNDTISIQLLELWMELSKGTFLRILERKFSVSCDTSSAIFSVLSLCTFNQTNKINTSE